MKKTLLSLMGVVFVAFAFSQAKPAVKKNVPTPAVAKSGYALKTAIDSLSYAIGVMDGNFFKTQGLTNVSSNALGQGFSDVLKGKTIISPEQADVIIRTQLQKAAKLKCQPNIDEGKKFLAENAKKAGVKQTASGLQYEVIKLGTGAKPADTSIVKVHYEGSLLNGKKFDSSRDRGEPATFPLNRVIRGWTEGVQLMPVGSVFKFYIPYDLGYGEQGSGEVIPGGSLLIFEVELIEIVKGE